MDRTEWPWNLEEEVEWKADLEARAESEEREDDLLEETIDSAVEGSVASPSYVPGPPRDVELEEDALVEKYSVTA